MLFNHSDKQILNCPTCDYSTKRQSHLQRHVSSTHETPNTAECELCGKILRGKESLKIHHNYVHNKKEWKFKCDICDKLYINKSELEKHYQRHSSVVEKHDCNECGRTFNSNEQYKSHIYRIHGAMKLKAFSCKICVKTFNTCLLYTSPSPRD